MTPEKERERTGDLLCFRSELVGLLLACLGLVACVPNACVAAAAWHYFVFVDEEGNIRRAAEV